MDSDFEKIKLAGEILREAREGAGFSVEQFADKTGISKVQIENIESSNYKYLPAKVYVTGFIKRYANILKINQNFIINQFEKELADSGLEITNKKLPSINRKSKFLTTKKIFIISAIILLIAVSAYFFNQLLFVFKGPNITLLNPENDIVVDFDTIDVKGMTDYGVEFSINSENVYVDQEGNFNNKVFLTEGLNRIDIIAKNRFGKVSEIVRNVTYQPTIRENSPISENQ